MWTGTLSIILSRHLCEFLIRKGFCREGNLTKGQGNSQENQEAKGIHFRQRKWSGQRTDEALKGGEESVRHQCPSNNGWKRQRLVRRQTTIDLHVPVQAS